MCRRSWNSFGRSRRADHDTASEITAWDAIGSVRRSTPSPARTSIGCGRIESGVSHSLRAFTSPVSTDAPDCERRASDVDGDLDGVRRVAVHERDARRALCLVERRGGIEDRDVAALPVASSGPRTATCSASPETASRSILNGQ